MSPILNSGSLSLIALPESMQWYPKRLDGITDALIYQSKFGGIYCNSLILANCTFTIIITF